MSARICQAPDTPLAQSRISQRQGGRMGNGYGAGTTGALGQAAVSITPPRPGRMYLGASAPIVRAAVERHGTPLLLLSRSALRRQFRSLAAALPGVELHYAVKSLPHPAAVA